MMLTDYNQKILFALLLLFCSRLEAKRLKPHQLIKCQEEECQLSRNHLELYSYVKRSIEGDFNLKGKEIFPLLRSVEILQKRFDSKDGDKNVLNGTNPVKLLLADQKLNEALKVFLSDEGRSLIDFYRSSVNGKKQNLACTALRIQDIERVSRKLNSSSELGKIFSKIHKRYISESANKCLSSSCDSFDAPMNKFDYIFGKHKYKDPIRNRYIDSDDYKVNVTADMIEQVRFDIKIFNQSREFETQELALCRFFSKSNITDCMISARDLKDIDFGIEQPLFNGTISSSSSSSSLGSSKLDEYLGEYYTKNLANRKENQTQAELVVGPKELELAKSSIVGECKQIRGFLDYNLIAINWYKKNGYIENKRFIERASWCPSLSYWLHVDRICGQLEGVESSRSDGEPEMTFEYEVANSI